MFCGISIDLLQNIARQRYIYTNSLRRVRLYGNQHDNTGSVVWIRHDFLKRGGHRNSIAILCHALDMKNKGFFSHTTRVIQIDAGGDDARKVGKGDAEMTAGILMDQTNIVMHGFLLQL